MNEIKNEIKEEEAIKFVNEYKRLCQKHKIQIRHNFYDEMLQLERINSIYCFIESLNDLLREYPNNRFKEKPIQ